MVLRDLKQNHFHLLNFQPMVIMLKASQFLDLHWLDLKCKIYTCLFEYGVFSFISKQRQPLYLVTDTITNQWSNRRCISFFSYWPEQVYEHEIDVLFITQVSTITFFENFDIVITCNLQQYRAWKYDGPHIIQNLVLVCRNLSGEGISVSHFLLATIYFTSNLCSWFATVGNVAASTKRATVHRSSETILTTKSGNINRQKWSFSKWKLIKKKYFMAGTCLVWIILGKLEWLTTWL